MRALMRPFLREYYARRDLGRDKAIYAELKDNRFMPREVAVQLSRRCNLRCSMCGWAAWKRNQGLMSMELFQRVLAEMKTNGIRTLNLSNPQGEPLLSPHAADCMRTGIREGFEVHLNTNCTPLVEKNILAICEVAESGRFSVQASFSGYDKASHEGVYAGSNFEHTSRKLHDLNEQLTRRGLQRVLTVNGIVMDPATKQKHLEYLASLGIESQRVRLHLPDNFGGILEVGTKDAEKGVYTLKTSLDHRSLHLCPQLANQMLVYDSGVVSACACRDSEGVMEIGDLTRQSLVEIQTGPRYLGMLQAFMDRDIEGMELCRKCDIPYGDTFGEH